MALRILTLLLLLAAGPAPGGPWMRAPGTGFYALSGSASDRPDQSLSGYIEYGLSQRLTLGADLDLSMPGSGAMSGEGRVFLRRPIRSGTWTSSYQIGLGGRTNGGAARPFASLGLGVGRGLTLRGRSGWLAIDTRLDLGRAAIRQIKLDTTFGLSLAERGKGMVQLFVTADAGGDVYTTLTPSYIFTPNPDGPSYVVGIEARGGQQAGLGIKLGLWRKF